MPADDLIDARRKRLNWIEQAMAADGLPAGEKLVLVRLGHYKNDKTGRCDPSLAGLAASVGMKVRGVQKILVKLEAKGRIRRRIGGHGPRDCTQYELLPFEGRSTSCGTSLDDRPRVHENDVRVNSGNANDVQDDRKERPRGQPNLKNQKYNQRTVSVGDTHGPDVEILDGEEKRPLTEAEIDVHFEKWWPLYPRAIEKGKARKAYRNAVKIGKVTVSELLHAVAIYAAARECADQDYYTFAPTKWLENECWGDDPRAHAIGSKANWISRRAAEMMNAWNERPVTTKREPEPHPQPDPRWVRIQAALEKELDPVEYKQLFLEAEFDGMTDGVVRLRVRAPYDVRKITGKYKERLLALWQAEEPCVSAVALSLGERQRRAAA